MLSLYVESILANPLIIVEIKRCCSDEYSLKSSCEIVKNCSADTIPALSVFLYSANALDISACAVNLVTSLEATPRACITLAQAEVILAAAAAADCATESNAGASWLT